MKKAKTHELSKRLLFTVMILVIYMAGRSLLLYNIDLAAYQLEELDSQNIMISMISGDRYQYTVFALGIMPFITSNLIMWLYTAVRGSEFKARLSPQKIERYSFFLMMVLAVIFAMFRVGGLVFKESKLDSGILKAIAVVEMIVGAVIIYKMVNLNKEYGIAAQTPIILVNILDNLFATIQKFTWGELSKLLPLSLAMVVIILIMENTLIRIRIQRVSIHSEYADKSYIAYKVDPIGVMPVMFAITFFMIPQLIVSFLLFLFEDTEKLQYIYSRMKMTDIVGVVIYLVIIFSLNILFSFIMLSPGETAEQLQKGGDSIVGIYAGRKTKKYLRKKLLVLCISSGGIFCLLMSISLGLSLQGKISPELALLPATAMILTGLLCNLYREVKAYRKFDSYSFFI